MPRTILIVEDLLVNRKILSAALSGEYGILEAESGEEALEILNREAARISAVLLDIQMPGMDGRAVLRRMRANANLTQVPVVMITASEEAEARAQCLALGANDFVTKPYNPEIIKHCLQNNIALNETASLVNAVQRDKLTGLYNRETFFEKVEEAVSTHEPGYYVMSCFDIDNFKVINDQFGSAEGDRVLRMVGRIAKADMSVIDGICARIASDNFAALFPAERTIEGASFADRMADVRESLPTLSGALVFSEGRYIVADLALSAAALYDRAYLAKQSVKGRYDAHVAYFDETMREKLLLEQQVIADMGDALQSGQFEAWYQPQFNHSTGARIGAEALVRWRHPQKGLISPGVFIPIFEQNGFVYSLDKYIWEQVCMHLRKWLDEGRRPLPVSVNISRYDIFCEDIVDVVTGLVQTYGIPVELLRLEITESAFSRSAEQIIAVVKRFLDAGFIVEIDDFGSGYSSLNTLKDVPAQIIKLDMRFLESSNSQRGGSIVESVVRMAKWLNMAIIAEGVETQEQADFLRSIGCDYMQGYLYARPMPAAEYEAFAQSLGKEERLLRLEAVENLDNNAFWDPKSMDTLIFNSYVGGASIFEYYNGQAQLLRINEKYLETFGCAVTRENVFASNPSDYMDEENRALFFHNIRSAIESGGESTCETCTVGLYGIDERVYVRTTVRVIARAGQRYLLYGTVANVTAQRQAEQALADLLDNLPCGAALYTYDGKALSPVHINRRYWELVERAPVDYKEASFLEAVHPADRTAIFEQLAAAVREGTDVTCELRVRRGESGYRSFHILGRIVPKEGGKYSIYVAYTPLSDEALSYQRMLPVALATVIGASADMAFVKDKDLRYVCCSAAFVQASGFASERELIGKTDYELVDKALADRFAAVDQEIMRTGRARLDYEEIMPETGDAARYGSTSKYPLLDASGSVIGIYSVTRDVTEFHTAYERLKLLTDSIQGGLATYVCTWDSIRLSYYNETFGALMGYEREEFDRLAEKDALFMAEKEDIPLIYEQLHLLIENGAPIRCFFRIRSKDGTRRWVSFRGTLSARRGDSVTVNAVFFDTTSQMEITERLRLSEEEYRLAMRHSGNTICRYNVADKTVTMSPEVAATLSLPEKTENVPEGPVQAGNISPETAADYIAFYDGIRSGQAGGFGSFQKRLSGRWRWIDAHYSTLFSAAGKPVSAVISYADVTEQREKETVYRKWQQSLQEKKPDSYTLFRCNLNKDASYETKEGSLLTFDFGSVPLDFNGRARAYVDACVFDEDRESYLALLNSDALLAGYYRGKRSGMLEYREKLPSGGVRWLRLTIDLVEYPHSSDVEAYLMYENIDERKLTELQTRELAETASSRACSIAPPSHVRPCKGCRQQARKPGTRCF